MRITSILILMAILLIGAVEAGAIDCQTNCDKKCRISLPFGGWTTEPGCKGDCEVKKAIACQAKIKVPDVPGSPSEIPSTVERGRLAVCAQDFEVFARGIILDCGRFRTPGRDREIIDWTKRVLVNEGVVRRSDFERVEIRFCDLRGNTAGIVPDRNLIFLDDSYHPLRHDYDLDHRGLVGLGALLAHEMVHVNQYRREGTDNFKCQYVEQLKSNGGRQDRSHRFERPAYEEEDRAYDYLERRLQHQTCSTFDGLSCFVPGGYLGDPCYCTDAGGREHRGLMGW